MTPAPKDLISKCVHTFADSDGTDCSTVLYRTNKNHTLEMLKCGEKKLISIDQLRTR